MVIVHQYDLSLLYSCCTIVGVDGVDPFHQHKTTIATTSNKTISELGLSHLLHTAANETIATHQQRRRQLWMHMGNYQDPSSIELRQPFGASDVHHMSET